MKRVRTGRFAALGWLVALALVGACDFVGDEFDPGSIAEQQSGVERADTLETERTFYVNFDDPTAPSPVVFVDWYDNLLFHLSARFRLYGSATVEFETTYHHTMVTAWNELNGDLDTVVELYRRHAEQSWSERMLWDDDSGDGDFSHLRATLSAGEYLVVIRRRWIPGPLPPYYRPIADLYSRCGGDGCAPPPLE